MHSNLLPNSTGEFRNRKLEAVPGTKLHKRSDGCARAVQKIKHENLQTNYFFFPFFDNLQRKPLKLKNTC